ncbi:unnamed protein product [[Candida] boidinii]|nr:unnamed protein product [[Candida] boidinii]
MLKPGKLMMIKDFEEYIVEESVPNVTVDEEKVLEEVQKDADEEKVHEEVQKNVDEEQNLQESVEGKEDGKLDDDKEEEEDGDDTVIHHDPEETAITEETNPETEIAPVEELQIEAKDEPTTNVSDDINYDDDDEFKATGEEDIKWEVS